MKPSANLSEDDLQVEDKVQDAKKRAFYIVKTVDDDDIEVFYAGPVSKTKAVSITISNTVILEDGQKAKVPADQYKQYKKLFRKSGLKKSVKIKKQ